MKQIIQSYRTGELELAEVPAPGPRAGRVLVRTVASVLSVGTERYMLELARKSLLGKALARPDLVRQMVAKVRAEGPAEAWRQAKGRLDDPVPLGYSSAGLVVSAGEGIEDLAEGDRVACSGAIHAAHAEFVSVPRTMLVRIPGNVPFEEAAFVTLGGIALHGVRMAHPEVGERIVVLGLGLLGLLAVQILKASGCRVLAADVAPDKVDFARTLGADDGAVIGHADLAAAARAFSGGAGADAVLVFAASDSNEPVIAAAEAARERGRLVVPGLVGLDLPRKMFYEKELSFLVSRAWGPGIYDPNYEAKGLDYPLAQVRWTGQRNLAAFLDLVAAGGVRIAPLISHRYPIERAVEAYESILAGRERFLGVVLSYTDSADPSRLVRMSGPAGAGPRAEAGLSAAAHQVPAAASGRDLTPRPLLRVGVIGAGLFAKGTILPLLRGKPGVELRGLAAGSGVGAHHSARRSGFAWCTTEPERVLSDPEIDVVLVLTRHGTHADLTARALRAGKHVFVEKPLALDPAQLTEVEDAWRNSRGQLMVGFNRRYAPLARDAARRLRDVPRPLVLTMRVNAGFVPKESWVHDPEEGGGRIVGEACHFVDLASGLCGSVPVSVHATAAGARASGASAEDLVLALRMADGSAVSICYASGGDKSFSRERVEVFGGGAACAIENFRQMSWSRNGRTVRRGGFWSGVDRGHAAEIGLLLESLREGRMLPVSFEDLSATTRATFAALESLRTGRPVPVVPGPPSAGGA